MSININYNQRTRIFTEIQIIFTFSTELLYTDAEKRHDEHFKIIRRNNNTHFYIHK